MPVIRQFAETSPPSNTQAELLDLLEAVVSYRGKKKVQLGNVVFFDQRLNFLAYQFALGKSRILTVCVKPGG